MWVSWWKSVQFDMEILLLRNENSRLTYCCYLVICITPFMVIAYLLIKGLWIIYQKSQNEVILPNTFSLWFILAKNNGIINFRIIWHNFLWHYGNVLKTTLNSKENNGGWQNSPRFRFECTYGILTGCFTICKVWQFDKKFPNEYNFYFHCRLSMGFGPSRFSAWQWLKRVPFYPTPVAF